MLSGRSAPQHTAGYRRYQKACLLLGPTLLAIVLLLPAPTGLAPQAQHLVALIALMAVWWSTEAVPLAATSLLPLVLLPVLGIMTPEAAAAPYADPNIFLFLGGFFLAQAFQRWDLHRRVALLILSIVGTQPRQLLLGFMLATAGISMWVSNTATSMMMLPIDVAVVSQIGPEATNPHENGYGNGVGTVFMLGIAYAASIGGMATLIGTPPNLIATPPNAVAFASGYVTVPQMVRAGPVIDLLGALLVTLAVTALGRPVFGLW
jgi:sodium-dependent dicarboxylate transporter 2/3/5